MRLSLDAKSPTLAVSLRKAGNDYARLVLAKIHEEMAHADKLDAEDKLMMKLGTDLVQSRRVHRDGAHLEWQAFSNVRVRDLVEAMASERHGRKTSVEVREEK